MAEFRVGESSQEHEHEPAPVHRLRTRVGMVLIAAGVGLCIWVVASLIGTLAGTDPPALVTAITPGEHNPVTIGLPEGKFTIPSHVFPPIGYLLVFFVNAILGTIAGVLINAGVALLQPDANKLMQKLMEKKGGGSG
jgi:ABC-type Na+ efflux pump permease subunit